MLRTMPTLGAKYAPKMGHPDLWDGVRICDGSGFGKEDDIGLIAGNQICLALLYEGNLNA